jgi:twitching motility protein PilT
MIDLINQTKALHIITVEDPIEYIHSHKKSIVEQKQIGIDSASFPRALRKILREDPDVILVGEMRDLETIQTAITAAETGHLVISTLHTPDAPQAIDRMIDVFPPYQQAQVRLQISLSLQGVIAQKLLPKKEAKGVVPAIEILISTPAVRNLIRKAQTHELFSVLQIGSKQGMQTMDDSLQNLYTKGIISYDTAISYLKNPASLEKLLKARLEHKKVGT